MIKKLTSLLGLALFILACYIAFLLSWPYYKAWEYESDARDIIRFSVYNIDEMKERLYKGGIADNIPVQENSILVTQDNEDQYQAKVSWTEVVDIFGYYHQTYEFHFDVGGRELQRKR
jgi:hypothetical protein